MKCTVCFVVLVRFAHGGAGKSVKELPHHGGIGLGSQVGSDGPFGGELLRTCHAGGFRPSQ